MISKITYDELIYTNDIVYLGIASELVRITSFVSRTITSDGYITKEITP